MPKLLNALKAKYKSPREAIIALGLDEHILDDVLAADKSNHALQLKETAMQMTKLGKALFAALCAASPVLAADSALPELVGSAARKDFDSNDVKAKLIVMDASIDSTKLDAVLDAILDVEQDPKPVETPAAAADGSPAEKLRALLAGKVDDETIEAACACCAPVAAADEKPDDEKDKDMKEEDVKAAMDSLRKELLEAEGARRDVRPVVGDVLGMDSACAVYGFALDHMKIDHTDIDSAPALRALFKVAASQSATPAPRVAQDSASLEKQFPGAARFRNA
jgi:hypothetical protein